MALPSQGANRYASVPCRHYRRHCSIVAPCCNHVFCCTRGHDESKTCRVKLDSARHLVNSVICNSCKRLQPVSRTCRYTDCKRVFGSYYCAVCLIWTDGHAFHCRKCKKCYKGKAEETQHCDVCQKCYPLSSRGHKCARFINCASCGENLSNSRQRLHVARCGHSFHETCFTRRIAVNFSCPHPGCRRPMADVNAWHRTVTLYCYRCQSRSQCRNTTGSFSCPLCRSTNVRILGYGSTGAGSSSSHAQRR